MNPRANARNSLPILSHGVDMTDLRYTSSKASYTVSPVSRNTGPYTDVPEYIVRLNNVFGSGQDTIRLWYASACNTTNWCDGVPNVTDTSFTITVNLPEGPSLTGISPGSGPTVGGSTVIISGTGFTGTTAVTFGDSAAINYVIDNARKITATLPARAAGSVDVSVITPNGTATGAGIFTYASAPVTAIRPDPSLDQDVVGLVNAQTITATRFARQQIRSFQGRLERLHDDASRRAASMDISVGMPSVRDASNAGQRINVQDQQAIARLLHGTAGRDADGYGYGTARTPLSKLAINGAQPEAGEGASSSDALSFWSSGFVNFGKKYNGGMDLDSTTAGGSGGVDYRFTEKFVGGFGLGYGRDHTEVGKDGNKSRSQGVSAAFYGSFEARKNLFFDGLIGWSWLNFNNRRFVTANGETAVGERNGKQLFGSLSAAYEKRNQAWLVSPYARLDFSRSWLDGYSENGGGIYGLRYGRQSIDTLSGAVGIRANHSFQMEWGYVTPGIRAEYIHDFEGSSRVNLGYVDIGTLPYVVETSEQLQDYLAVGVTLDFEFQNDWMLGFGYDANLASEGVHSRKVLHAPTPCLRPTENIQKSPVMRTAFCRSALTSCRKHSPAAGLKPKILSHRQIRRDADQAIWASSLINGRDANGLYRRISGAGQGTVTQMANQSFFRSANCCISTPLREGRVAFT